jgi:hypothetical protein
MVLGVFGMIMCVLGLMAGSDVTHQLVVQRKWVTHAANDVLVAAIFLVLGGWCCFFSYRWGRGKRRR